jgi:hypothetical protein
MTTAILALLATAGAMTAADVALQPGMTSLEALAALGEAAVFAPTCLDRMGPAVSGPVQWRGAPIWVTGVIQADRVVEVRLHGRLEPEEGLSQAQCAERVRQWTQRLDGLGVKTSGAVSEAFEGPFYRWRQSVGGDEAAIAGVYRASRGGCQVWLELGRE